MTTSSIPRCATLLLLITAAVPVPAAAECSVSGAPGANSDVADVARAIAACETARARFAELFGDAVPRAHVVLHEEPGYEVASVGAAGVVFWPTSTALPTGAPAAWLERQWSEVLPHELMHALTMARFYSDGGGVDSLGYGTPLPDWFEEGIAIWGEPSASRAGRLAQARALPAHRLELSAILRSAHPIASDPELMAAIPGAAVPRHDDLLAFYPQSIAVLSYVFDAGGAAAVRELARRLVADPGAADALAGLPGLGATMADVERGWQQWLGPG
jgi:hypothetical protein